MTPRIEQLPPNMQSKIVPHGECWLWAGALNSRGYSSVADGKGGTVLAHRRAYELLVGPIPDGLTIDHLCRTKACVNPLHLEPVTGAENTRRKLALQTHCKHGHPLSGENLHIRVRPNGLEFRECLTCRRANSRRYYDTNYVPATGRRRAKRALRIDLAAKSAA